MTNKKSVEKIEKIEKVEKDDRTVFERQEDAWLDNDCEGSIEDYDQ